MRSPPLFCFGAMSPYSWFAAERTDALLPEAEWRPVFAGGVFKACGWPSARAASSARSPSYRRPPAAWSGEGGRFLIRRWRNEQSRSALTSGASSRIVCGVPRPSGHEQRTAPRAAVALDVRLERGVGRAVNARTLDLGAGGARVRSTRPLRVDEELHFDVDLPAGGGHVDGTARVLRQDRHDVYALRFEGLAHATLAELREFVDASTGASLH